MVTTITDTLIRISKNFAIKILVSMRQNKTEHYSLYNHARGCTMSYDTSNVLRLEYSDDKPWSGRNWLSVNTKHVYQLKDGFIEMKKLMDDHMRDMFKLTPDGAIKCIADDEDKVIIDGLGFDQFIKLIPGVVYDNDLDTTGRVGVYLVINDDFRVIGLSLDEFDAIYYIIKDVNITQLAHNLIQMHSLEQIKQGVLTSTNITGNTIKSSTDTIKNELKAKGVTSIFDVSTKDEGNEGVVISSIPKKKPDSLDQL